MNMKQVCLRLTRRSLSKPSVPTPASPFRRLSQTSPSKLTSPAQQWQRLSSTSGWACLPHRQYDIFSMQAYKLSSSASPLSEKDAGSDSSLEENCVSGEEVVEPVIKGQSETSEKDEQQSNTVPQPPEKKEKEPPGKPESSVNAQEKEQKKEDDKEAVLRFIAAVEAKIAEKEGQLKELQERSVSSKAELENVRARLQRESDIVKKFAIQGFAKSLLDVADNLGRALMTVPDDVRKELVADQSEIGRLLQSFIEGLMLTEKELMKVFKKFGIEKFEPTGQQFDPNSHLALFEVPDPTKEPGTIAAVVKVGYMLHDRVLRPAEVGVVKSLE